MQELSGREIRLLEILAEGAPFKIVAEELGISEQYAKNLSRVIRTKLGADNTVQAVVMAIRRKIIT